MQFFINGSIKILFFFWTAFLMAICLMLFITPSLSPDENSYGHAMHDKMELLKKTPSPKIILIGGSNIAFGIDSQFVRSKLGMPVVNMGVAGSLGLQTYINLVLKDINPGDIVLVMSEYSPFYKSGSEDSFLGVSSTLFTMFSIYPALWDYLNVDQKYILLQGVGKGFYQAMKKKFQNPGLASAVYRRNGFNAEGDLISHLELESSKAVDMENMTSVISVHALQVVDEFSKKMKERNVTVFFGFEPIPITFYQKNAPYIKKLEQEILEYPNINYLYPAKTLVFPQDYFFEPLHHLNKNGRRIRTEIVSSLVKERLLRQQ